MARKMKKGSGGFSKMSMKKGGAGGKIAGKGKTLFTTRVFSK